MDAMAIIIGGVALLVALIAFKNSNHHRKMIERKIANDRERMEVITNNVNWLVENMIANYKSNKMAEMAKSEDDPQDFKFGGF